MPKKKKGKKKGGKGKGKGKAKLQAATERDEQVKAMKCLIKAYQSRYSFADSNRVIVSGQIVQELAICAEEEKLFIRVILDPGRLLPPSKKLSGRASRADQSSISIDQSKSTLSQSHTPPLILCPLLESAAEAHYNYLRCVHIWHLPLTDDDVVSLALSFESGLLSLLKVLELMDTSLSEWAVQRLTRSLKECQLSYLMMDYNRLTHEGLTGLCKVLQTVPCLQTLSLNYCHLVESCGDQIGTLVAMSQIRELRLAGNELQATGATDLIRPIVAVSEVNEEYPMLAKLLLQDNAIDYAGEKELFGPVACMRAFRRWIACCKRVEEVNVDRNLIGDAGANELLLALQQRKEGGHPAIKLAITNKVHSELFEALLALTASKTKKGKKGKKKKGKKKK